MLKATEDCSTTVFRDFVNYNYFTTNRASKRPEELRFEHASDLHTATKHMRLSCRMLSQCVPNVTHQAGGSHRGGLVGSA